MASRHHALVGSLSPAEEVRGSAMLSERLRVTVNLVEVEAVRPVNVLCDIEMQATRFVLTTRCHVLCDRRKELLSAVRDDIQ